MKPGTVKLPVVDPRNERLLAALTAGEPLDGRVLVRRDGSVVDVAEAKPEDWQDLGAQVDLELALVRHRGLS